MKNKKIEQELQKRLQSRNAFIPDAGLPDPNKYKKKTTLEEITKENTTIQTTQVRENESGKNETLEQKNSEQYIQQNKEEMEDNETSQSYEIPKIIVPHQIKTTSQPYAKGDNIFLELINYYQSDKLCSEKSTAIIKEEHNCLLATVSAASGLSAIIEGPSRSGKSLIADKLEKILTDVYKVEICSNKALFSDAEEINKHDFMYIAEFQAALENNPDIKETIKLLTEHKDATNRANGKTQTIDGKITIISTGADENARTQKRDVEVTGRFVVLRTRSDPEKIRSISEYQDRILMGEEQEKNYEINRFEKLKTHLKNIISTKFEFENPFAKAYALWLPETQKSIHYRTLYTGLINGFTKFDFPNRTQKENKLLTNIADIYLVHTLYHPAYCDALKKLSLHSYNSLEKILPEQEKQLKILEDELNLIEKATQTPVDWQAVWDAGYKQMRERNPNLTDEWTNNQTKNGKIIIYDPVKQQDLEIAARYD